MVTVLEIAPKVTRYLGFFCRKIYRQNLLKIAQSCCTASYLLLLGKVLHDFALYEWAYCQEVLRHWSFVRSV